MMKEETKVAIQAAEAAGAIAKKYFGKAIAVERKSDNSPVTKADRECEEKIKGILKKQFPDYSVLGEESGFTDSKSECKWIIDPIDGTREFVSGLPFFGTLIALEENGKIVSGVISMPLLGKLAHAEAGKGAFVNGKKAAVSTSASIEESLIMYGSLKNFFKRDMGDKIISLIRLSMSKNISATYSYFLLAEGIAGASIESISNPWDMAAPKIIVEEAGGRATDISGKDTIYGGNSIMSNGKLHEKIIEILNK